MDFYHYLTYDIKYYDDYEGAEGLNDKNCEVAVKMKIK